MVLEEAASVYTETIVIPVYILPVPLSGDDRYIGISIDLAEIMCDGY
jgi:hypothetical protein